jgi:nucleoside-diphosphate-sugar epimerase
MMKKIAVLGATSHIAKGLIYNFLNEGTCELVLFARNSDAVKAFLKTIGHDSFNAILPIDLFGKDNYDVIINCIGLGMPKNAKTVGRNILALTEYFDNIILDYLGRNSDSMYINFSSGAVFGKHFREPVSPGYENHIDVNAIGDTDYYSIAKLHSETKHRSFGEFKIIDLRVFSYFSRFIDMSAGYLITEMINCIREKKTFLTSSENIIRDYVIQYDLFALVKRCIQTGQINTSFDVYSREPVSKLDLAGHFHAKYGLTYEIIDNLSYVNPTGDKLCYYSKNLTANEIGYHPEFSSLSGIDKEIDSILK